MIFWNHVRFGGGIGLGFNNGGFNTSVSPSAIYRFNGQFAAGTALNFNYAKYRDAQRTYGAHIVAVHPIPFLPISAELEQLRVNNRFENLLVRFEEDYWSPALFLGVGYGNLNHIGAVFIALANGLSTIFRGVDHPFFKSRIAGQVFPHPVGPFTPESSAPSPMPIS